MANAFLAFYLQFITHLKLLAEYRFKPSIVPYCFFSNEPHKSYNHHPKFYCHTWKIAPSRNECAFFKLIRYLKWIVLRCEEIQSILCILCLIHWIETLWDQWIYVYFQEMLTLDTIGCIFCCIQSSRYWKCLVLIN